MDLQDHALVLLATTMLVVQTVQHVLKATAAMPPGVSLIVYLVLILLMTALWRVMGTSTAQMEEPLVDLLDLARALPVLMKVLEVQTVQAVQRVISEMLPGVSLSVYLVPILLMTVHWRVMGTSSA